MLFYEDLVKKIETGKIEDIKKIEKFGLNKAKNISGYGIAIPLILIGLFEVYSYTIYHKWYLLLIGALFFALGLKQAKTVFTYSIKVDTEAKNIKFKNLNFIDFQTFCKIINNNPNDKKHLKNLYFFLFHFIPLPSFKFTFFILT